MNEEENNFEEDKILESSQKQSNEIEPSQKVSLSKKIWRFVKKHFVSSILLLALLVVIVWFYIKLNSIKKQLEMEKSVLTEKYEFKIDSIQQNNIEFTSRVFSWSVRSEMIRNNEENLNQLVTVFIKESDATLMQIVSYEKNSIIISSDKKLEGEKFVAPKNVDLKEQVTITNSEETIVYTPIYGLNNDIGLLIVKTRK